MNAYKTSLKKLAADFLRNPINFVAEADLQARLVEILKKNLRNKNCDIKQTNLKNDIPDSYKKEYYRKIQQNLKKEQSIGRVHTEVSFEKNKRFDIIVFKPKIDEIRIRGPDLAGGSKRFEEEDAEAAFELKFIKNKYYVPKEENAKKIDFDSNYNKIPKDLNSLKSLSKVKKKFLVIFSNFNFFFENMTSKEKKGGNEEIIKRSEKARKKLANEGLENNIDILYTHPKKSSPRDIEYESLLLKD